MSHTIVTLALVVLATTLLVEVEEVVVVVVPLQDYCLLYTYIGFHASLGEGTVKIMVLGSFLFFHRDLRKEARAPGEPPHTRTGY